MDYRGTVITVHFFFILFVVVSSASSNCPCETPSLCAPIKTTPKKEIFTFSLTNSSDVWGKYNWSLVTTVVTVGYHSNDLMCLAHKHGARIVMLVGYGPVKSLTNTTERRIWTRNVVKTVQQYYLDGVNFDFESEINRSEKAYRDGYTALVNETRLALRSLNPSAQVSVDVPWSPDHIYGRYYDYAGLARDSDFLVIMDYDERSVRYVAGANSDIKKLYLGIKLYLQLMDPSKLVAAAPWYGYDYPCVKLFDNICLTDTSSKVQYTYWSTPSRGYDNIMTMLYKNSTSGRLWDVLAETPYFNYKSTVDQKYHQIWYDDVESLTYKYKMVKSFNLRGTGMWHADTLNYTNTTEVQQMWGAMSVINNGVQI